MITIKTIKNTICCGNPKSEAASNTKGKLLPANAKIPIAQSIITRQLVKSALRLIFLDKIGNNDVAMIPKKMLIVEKIENAFGIPII